MSSDPLDVELDLARRAKNPDTAENFAAVYAQIAELTVPVGHQYVRSFSASGRSTPLVAFFLPNTELAAHAVNLQTYLRALQRAERRLEPIVLTFGKNYDALSKALGVSVHAFSKGTHRQRWLALQEFTGKLNLDALVHVSNPVGLPFAATIRCARKHIWWAMKWHTKFAGVDGYIDGNDPFHAGGKISHGVHWRSAYTALPDLFVPDASANIARRNIDARTVYCTMARDEKYSPEFQDCVRSILIADPTAVYVYASKRPIPLQMEMKGRVIHQGWVNTRRLAQVADIFLDTFPFGGGHIAYEIIAAKKPLVLMDIPSGEQIFPAASMKKAGSPVLAANSREEYVAQALAYREPSEWPNIYHAFYEKYLRDEARMAREVSAAIIDVLSEP